ncbi:hypothetical protein [Methanobrevibacter sp.]|uniref:hypothetical protein n=1 Tax=Methanobrevibacter sp. TaxID=66852 RepID=UPI00388F5D0A
MDSNVQIKEFVSESTNIKSIITMDDRKFSTIGHIEELEVTKNGTYTKKDVAFSPVVVNVQSTVEPPDWYTDGADSVVPDDVQLNLADLSETQTYQTIAFAGDGSTINEFFESMALPHNNLIWIWNSNGVFILGYTHD